MSRPLRCALLIPAPEAAVRRALGRVDVWTRSFRAIGYRTPTDLGAGPLRPGTHVQFRARRTFLQWGTAEIRVEQVVRELPELQLRFGASGFAAVRLRTAVTAAGTLVTVEFTTADRALHRRRVLAFGEMLLAIATVTARDPQVVVAGAVIKGDRVLAARRARPPELAGKWEMPGGKVDPGEGEREALARELFEELGIEVWVGEPIGPAVDLGEGLVLHSYEALLRSGNPRPMEPDPAHDLVRWLAVSELDDVTWLPGDQPFVDAVRERLTAIVAPLG